MPWPSYPLYPLMASRAGAKPVAVEHFQDLREAVTDRTRVVVLCNPNDPTGTYMPAEELGALVLDLPRDVHVLVDEALVHFQDVEPVDCVLRLTDAFPNLIVFRTFRRSTACPASGPATRSPRVPGPDAGRDRPVLGVNALTQAAVDQALKIGGPEVERRRASVVKERIRLLEALRELPVDVTDSQANFIWLTADGVSGHQLTSRLAEQGVIVAPGGPLGADGHVRAAIRNSGATDRLLNALSSVL